MNLPEINFEQAKLLKQAGFVEHTTKFYDKNGVLTGSLPVNHNLHKDRFSCVTVALAFMWLRETKCIDVAIMPHMLKNNCYLIRVVRNYTEKIPMDNDQACPHSYAESLGLDKALEILTTTP